MKQRYNIKKDASEIAFNRMNEYGLDNFNKSQRQKYGDNYLKRDEYTDELNVYYRNMIQDIEDKKIKEIIKNDKNYKKAQKLVRKYDMLSWSEIAQENNSYLNSI